MVKSQKELFEINDNADADAESTNNKKQKKPKKKMTDEDKTALIERLKAGKERKRLEREGKSIPKKITESPAPQVKENSINITTTKIDPRDLEIKELKNMIKETKNKLEMQALKDELKELRNLIKQEKKEELTLNKEPVLDTKLSLNIKDEEFWSKNNISPGTYFMDKLSNKLKELSDVKSDKYKQIISYSTKIIIDDYHNFGEGEIKIMSWVRNNLNSDLKKQNLKNCNIGIYSPDADMILLSLLLKAELDNNQDLSKNNLFPSIYFLRYNQQNKEDIPMEKKTDIILIDKLKELLIDHIILDKKINDKKREHLIIRDIIFIFTSLGDDFLPKLNSINANSDVNILLDLYSFYLRNNEYIINDNNLQINYKNFVKFLEMLEKIEDIMIKRNNIKNKYTNFNYYLNNLIKKVIDKLELFSLEIKSLLKSLNIDLTMNNIEY